MISSKAKEKATKIKFPSKQMKHRNRIKDAIGHWVLEVQKKNNLKKVSFEDGHRQRKMSDETRKKAAKYSQFYFEIRLNGNAIGIVCEMKMMVNVGGGSGECAYIEQEAVKKQWKQKQIKKH